MSLDRDWDEASAWMDIVHDDTRVSAEAEIAYLLGEGADPWAGRASTPAEETWLRALEGP